MIEFKCQPDFFGRPFDCWQIAAPSAREAAELFQAMYDVEQICESGDLIVRTVDPDGITIMFQVTRKYSAEETQS